MNNIYILTRMEHHLEFVIEHCILAVAFFLPLSLEAVNVFLTVGVVAWGGKMLLKRSFAFVGTPFDGLIALLVVFSAGSIWCSPDRGFSFYNYYHLMGRYLLIYYFVVNNVKSMEEVKRLIWVVLAAAVVVSGYGFYQYLFGSGLTSAEWVDNEQFPDLKVRVFSTLENPNLLGGFLVTMISLAGGLGLRQPRERGGLVLALVVLVFGLCLGLTYSRGAWISLLAVIIICGLLYNRRLLWLLLVVPVFAFFAHDMLMERFMSILNPTDTSSTLRMALWESTVAMIMDKPFFGIGWGAYWMVYPNYDFFINNTSTKIVHAHNMYLNIAAEIGLPGLMAFLAIMYGHAKTALTIFAGSGDKWVSGLMLGMVAAIAGLAVNGLTDYIMFNIQMSMLFWLLNAIIVVVRQKIYMFDPKTPNDQKNITL